MNKVIDFSKTLYEIYSKNPEIIDILYELGFHDIAKPGMINTAGRFITIPKGAAMKKISLEDIKKKIEDKGYKIQE